nr:MAG TPA: hypothetical protein [Caudoviricetes sp.]
MNFTEWAKTKSIDGIDEGTLKGILQGTHPSSKLKEIAPGVLVIEDTTNCNLNERIICCVSDYYTNREDHKKIKIPSLNNVYSKCLKIQNELGIREMRAERNDCTLCHLLCMDRIKDGSLNRVNSLKKKGK